MPEQKEDLTTDKLEKLLSENESFWNKNIENLSKGLSCSAKDVVSLQANIISTRQELAERIKTVSYDLFKFMPKIKAMRKQRFEYYHTTYSLTTNASEKMKLIEWDLASFDHKKDMLDNHIEFLRETLKNMDNLNFAVKNKITLYQLTDLE